MKFNELEKLKRENERLRSLVLIADKLIPAKGSWWRRWQKAKKDLGFVNDNVSFIRSCDRSLDHVCDLSSQQAIS